MRSLSRSKWLRWVAIRANHRLDMRLKGSRLAPSSLIEFPLCYLTTTGRKSGEPRVVPLVYVPVDAGTAVVATNYGQQHHPAWSYNLEANPRAVLEIDEVETAVVARRATDAEYAVAWPLFQDAWPGYEDYEAMTPRDIRMYVLVPTAPS